MKYIDMNAVLVLFDKLKAQLYVLLHS